MIGFEEQTQPLTAWEQHNLLPVMLAGLRTKVGQDKAVTLHSPKWSGPQSRCNL